MPHNKSFSRIDHRYTYTHSLLPNLRDAFPSRIRLYSILWNIYSEVPIIVVWMTVTSLWKGGHNCRALKPSCNTDSILMLVLPPAPLVLFCCLALGDSDQSPVEEWKAVTKTYNFPILHRAWNTDQRLRSFERVCCTFPSTFDSFTTYFDSRCSSTEFDFLEWPWVLLYLMISTLPYFHSLYSLGARSLA